MTRKKWKRRKSTQAAGVPISLPASLLPESHFFSDQTQDDMIRLCVSDFLTNSGWMETVSAKRPVRRGSPIPWFTFPAIEILDRMSLQEKRVLEVGSGYSTLYWLVRKSKVVAFESDPQWARQVENAASSVAGAESFRIVPLDAPKYLESDLQIQLRQILGIDYATDLISYLSAPTTSSEEGLDSVAAVLSNADDIRNELATSDVIVIDGIARNLLCALASKECRDDALIILDNSDRSDYEFGKKNLMNSGWCPTEFCGLGPINPYQWTTTFWRRRRA